MEDLVNVFKIKSSLPPWVSELSQRTNSLLTFFEDFQTLFDKVLDTDLFPEALMGRLLPLTPGHVCIPTQEEQHALKDMIIQSGFLRNDNLIPIIKVGDEDPGPDGGELQCEEMKTETVAMLDQIASLP